MKQLIEKALLSIGQMSQSQFAERLASAKSNQLALAVRDLGEFALWSSGSICSSFATENLFADAGLASLAKVKYSIPMVDATAFVYAANDERFALAA